MILGVGAQLVGGARLAQRRAVAHASEHVGNDRVVLARVDDRVGCNVGNAALARQPYEPDVSPSLYRRQMLLQLDIKAIAEDRFILQRSLGCVIASQRDQPAASSVKIVEL